MKKKKYPGRKPGPEKLPDEFKRSVRKEVQFTKTEWQRVRERAAITGVTTAVFIRTAALLH